MTLPLPSLDDRSFDDLVREAKALIARHCPTWTDLSVHDPGVALIEAFAYLTETMIYRLNRLPDRAYVAFLNLIGATLEPPVAARAELAFTRMAGPTDKLKPMIIPARTAVSAVDTTNGGTIRFVTANAVTVPGDESSAIVDAHHCEYVDGEIIGVSTGVAGQRLRAGRAPMVRRAGANLSADVIVAVETSDPDVARRGEARMLNGVAFEPWAIVPVLTESAGSASTRRVCRVDMNSGIVQFPPALLGDVPPAGARIAIWYATGGGARGNVAQGVIRVIGDPALAAQWSVSNPGSACGGAAAEDLESAKERGPALFRTNDRAVTAADYEAIALRSSRSVSRAHAFNRSAMWAHATPGEVEVLLVPSAQDDRAPRSRTEIEALQTEAVRASVARSIDHARPLGTSAIVRWSNVKEVAVRVRVVVRPDEDAAALGERIAARLDDALSPLATRPGGPGRAFGQALWASNVHRVLEEGEGAVRHVDNVRLAVDEAPDADVRSIAVDGYQARTWFVASGSNVYRSLDDGDGWEVVVRLPGPAMIVRAYPAPPLGRPGFTRRAGFVAAIADLADGGSQVWMSTDLGERWEMRCELTAQATDLAWAWQGGDAVLYVATHTGLLRLLIAPGAVPEPVVIDPETLDLGVHSVTCAVDIDGELVVAAAAEQNRGVYLAYPMRSAGWVVTAMRGRDVRGVHVEYRGPNETYLWALLAGGTGIASMRVGDLDETWTDLAAAHWPDGASCWALGFAGGLVLAATQSDGVQCIDRRSADPRWAAPAQGCGLPLRADRGFEPVVAIGVRETAGSTIVIAGGPAGLHRSNDLAVTFCDCAARESDRLVTIPSTWLLVGGRHDIEIVVER